MVPTQILTDLVVVLESLGEVVLNVKGSRQLVATLGPHGFVLGVVECVQGQVLDLGVVLLKEEVVGKVVEDHRVGGVDGVGLGQFSDTLLKLTKGRIELSQHILIFLGKGLVLF